MTKPWTINNIYRTIYHGLKKNNQIKLSLETNNINGYTNLAHERADEGLETKRTL